jgi:hypothetical protein
MSGQSLVILALFLWISSCHSVYWDASVGSWHIHRQSETLSFQMDDLCTGNISAVNVSGRSVDGYHSRYFYVDLNDVSINDRTGAFTGNLSFQDVVSVMSEADEDVTRAISKSPGSPLYIFNFTEVWPVLIRSDRAVIYNGSGINERDIASNNLDYASTSFSQCRELSKVRTSDLVLKRMNVTVIADEEDYRSVEFLPTKYLDYNIDAYSSGMADLSYRQTSPDMVRPVNEGDEQYRGSYFIGAGVSMGTADGCFQPDDNWLGLCSSSKSSCPPESDVFDCRLA